MANRDKAASEQQTLSRTLAFLSSIATSCVSLSVTEIADELKVSKPTAYAIVNSLVSQGYLEKDSDSGKYHIGYCFYAMGQSYPRMYPFLIYAESYALELFENMKLRINLCVYKPPMTSLVIASKDTSLVPRRSGGYMLPAHLSASGKVMLASLPKEKSRELIMAADLYPLTPRTITDHEELLRQLADIREQGFATDEEEFVSGRVCVAAPIYDASGSLACTISVAQCPVKRFVEQRDYIIKEVKNTALQISLEMGYPKNRILKSQL